MVTSGSGCGRVYTASLPLWTREEEIWGWYRVERFKTNAFIDVSSLGLWRN